jgi:hypothetical protein
VAATALHQEQVVAVVVVFQCQQQLDLLEPTVELPLVLGYLEELLQEAV